jgi:hypothetical protein
MAAHQTNLMETAPHTSCQPRQLMMGMQGWQQHGHGQQLLLLLLRHLLR